MLCLSVCVLTSCAVAMSRHTSYCASCYLGNTRVITQQALQTFQEEMQKVLKDPYKVRSIPTLTWEVVQWVPQVTVCYAPWQVVMRRSGLPVSLLNESAKVS